MHVIIQVLKSFFFRLLNFVKKAKQNKKKKNKQKKTHNVLISPETILLNKIILVQMNNYSYSLHEA